MLTLAIINQVLLQTTYVRFVSLVLTFNTCIERASSFRPLYNIFSRNAGNARGGLPKEPGRETSCRLGVLRLHSMHMIQHH